MAASDTELGELHKVLAQQLKVAIVKEDVTAAILGVTVAFLKNNNITADAVHNAELDGLKDALQARRTKGKLSRAALEEAAKAFEDASGGGLVQ